MPGRWLPGLAAAAIVLVPYTTVTLPFRTALMVQAALILAVLGVTGMLALRQAGHLLEQLPSRRLLAAGALLYTAAALLATAVALARGNPLTLLAGQLASMLLLPLGLVAGSLLADRRAWWSLSLGLGGAVTLACGIHFVAWASALAAGQAVVRLFLGNAVAVVGCAPLALLLLAALRRRGRRRWWPADLGLAAVALYLLGSGVRGAWLVLPPALLLFALLASGGRLRVRRRTAVAMLGLLALAAGLGLGLHGWLNRPRPNLLPADSPALMLLTSEIGLRQPLARTAEAQGLVLHWDGKRSLTLLDRLAVDAGRSYRLRAWLRGDPRGRGYLAVRWLDAGGRTLDSLSLTTRGTADRHLLEAIGRPPAGTVAASVVLGQRGQADAARYTLERLELHALGPAWAAPLVRQGAYTLGRLAALTLTSETAAGEPGRSLRYRLDETRHLAALVADAGWRRQLLGHGLGATFRLDGAEHNYIHNFYAFLAFKLGLAGTLMVLAAFVCWTLHLVRQLRARPRHSPGRRFLAAVLAALAGYLLWSLTSPEILDFRVAPLWGLLLAATAMAGSAPHRP